MEQKTLLRPWSGFLLFLKNTHEELRKRKKLSGFADEGGYWPNFNKNENILIFLSKIIEKSGLNY